MKQTAVEWLFEKMTEQGTNPYWDMRFIQAKEMEKEQMIEFANNYGFHICGYDYENAEQYYNETHRDDT
jgi:hypothetical protein